MGKNLNSGLSVIHDNWPLIINLVILWIIILILYTLSVKMNQGNFSYVLDDAYIHMAMAKHFTQEGVWGITIYGFSSSTSSILWVLILSSSYYLFGVNDITPFILNIIFSTATLILVYFIFKKCQIPSWYNAIALLLITIFTPLPSLVFIGMEHSLQIFLTIAFVYISAITLYKNKNRKSELILLITLSILLVLTRYESLILIGIVSILFLARKQYINTISILIFSTIPLIIYGIISTSKGWFFIPNSLIAKSNLFNTKTSIISLKGLLLPLQAFLTNLERTALVILILAAVCLFLKSIYKKNNFWDLKNILLTIFISLSFINFFVLIPKLSGIFFYLTFRYDSFIVAVGIFVLAITLREYIPQKPSLYFDKKRIPRYLAIIVLITIIIPSFGVRAYTMVDVPQATNNIYEQQYQMGLFLKEYYTNESVAINDIGAVNYLADIKCLDLWALGNLESLKYYKAKYTPDTLDSLTKEKNIKILIICETSFAKVIPNGWVKVGEWKIKNNKVCADDVVSIYATNPEEEQKLIQNLKNYSTQLPPDVEQKGKYVVS